MPQTHKKVAFSNKQKKEQLKARRQNKSKCKKDNDDDDTESFLSRSTSESKADIHKHKEKLSVTKLNEQPVTIESKYNPNRYKLHFQAESQLTAKQRTALSRLHYSMLPEDSLEMDVEACYDPDLSQTETRSKQDDPSQTEETRSHDEQSARQSITLDMPKRPPWDYKMSAQQLNDREQKYFKEYVDETLMKSKAAGRELSYFELNLETWRQLWRVVEMSDLILLISDIRNPALHFSPSLYRHVTQDLGKNMILILNKIDLAPAPLVAAWMEYFHSKFPQLRVVCFTSFPLEEKDEGATGNDAVMRKERRRRRNFTPAVGPKQLLKACQELVGDKVDLSDWSDKIAEDTREGGGGVEEAGGRVEIGDVREGVMSTDYEQHEMYRDGIFTIGCCGYPNVGKSSLINGLMGKKVVSVSRTPGHTKHFQTIFLTRNVRLCDCPGLVFPSYICRPLQVLSGMYPVAQVRDPYGTVRFLAERINLPQLLKIKHPLIEDEAGSVSQAEGVSLPWSAFYICDAWAEKRGFKTAKAARNDTHRAANHLLRLSTQGRILLCLRPPEYTRHKDEWERSEATAEIRNLQALHAATISLSDDADSDVTDTDDDDDDDVDVDDKNDDADDGESQESHSTHLSNKFNLLAADDD